MRVLVTGSRTWGDLLTIRRALADLVSENPGVPVVVVHGANPNGADAIAGFVARSWGPPMSEEPHPAKWNLHGRRAGHLRNEEMVRLGAVVCLAFLGPCVDRDCPQPMLHDSHGTADCVRRARAAHIPVREFTPQVVA